MSELRRLFTYLTPYWPRVAGALVGLTLSSLITLVLPLAVRQLVDSVFVQRDYAALNWIGLALLGIFLFQTVVSFSYRYLLQSTAQRTIADLRMAIHHHLLLLPLDFFANRRTGDLVSRVSNDVATLQGALVDTPTGLIRQLLTVGGGLAIMFWSNWQLTLIILLMMPPLMFVATFYGKRLKGLATVEQDRQAQATVVLEEMLSGVRVVKSFGREPYEVQRYGQALEAALAAATLRARERSTFVPLISLLGFAAIVVLIWVGGRQVIAGTMTPGELIAYLFYMVFVSGPLAETANLWGRLQEAAGASKRVFEILDTAGEGDTARSRALRGNAPAPLRGESTPARDAERPSSIPPETGGTSSPARSHALRGNAPAPLRGESALARDAERPFGIPPETGGTSSPARSHALRGNAPAPLRGESAPAQDAERPSGIPPVSGGTSGMRQGHVRFVDVSFYYQDPEGQPLPGVLHSIHIDAQPGQVIALVGYSGAGKTTLVNLLPRFYEPTSGQIELDGIDIRRLPLTDLRSQIGLVPQETFLFGGTVRENIAYGRLEASDAEIQAAAAAAYAHDFIGELPKGYATVVGERGIKLSAGQRQRIAIARALLKDPRILILDEATSALDTESERWVQAALERLMTGRTSFVIAHRLSTIQRADLILVLEQGRIVEQGTHGELLAQGGVYQRLYEMQFVGEASELVARAATSSLG